MSHALSRLGARVVIIGLLMVVPALAVILYEQASDRRQARTERVEDALRVAHLAADEQGEILRGVHRLLATLSHDDDFRSADGARCQALLPAVLRDHGDYINIFAVNEDGSLFCYAKPPAAGRASSPQSMPSWLVRARQTRTPAFGDYQISATNGKPDVILAAPVIGPSGRVQRVIAAAIGLDQLEAMFRRTKLPAGATLTLTDRNGTILARMPNDGSWIGRRHPQLQSISQGVSEPYGEVHESKGTDGIERMYAVVPVDAGIESGLSLTLDIDSSAIFPEANWLLLRHNMLFGLVTLFAIAVALIGGHRAIVRPVEQQRVETEERMRFALEAARIGIWDADLKTGVALWSATSEAMHGLEAGTFGRSYQAFIGCIHPDDRARVEESIARATREHQNLDLEYRTVWPDGTERHIAAKCRFFYDEAGTAARGAGISVDVTDQRSLEEQLRQSQKMEAVGRLAGGIAHDFNNMLMAILGNAELLSDDVPRGDKRRKDLDEIMKAAQRAATLTQQLLAFSRKQILEPRVLHLGDVVNGLAPMLRTLLGETIDLRTTMADRRRVKADAGQVEQVLMNLAVNARDAMKDGGRLTIETADVDLDDEYARHHAGLRPGAYVMVAVSDTGHGMDATTQKRIFEPFFTTKPVGQGTGLGLATVYGIVQQSGGHINVYSEPERGTSFKVYLPKTDERPDAAVSAKKADAPRGREAVLVVEDEAVVRDLVTKVLTRQGYRVHAVDSPRRAIEFVEANPTAVDLILTDVVLPEMSGPAMILELQEHAVAPAVVYMSGYTEEAILHQAVLNPETFFLHKPFTGDKLAITVRDALDAVAVA